MPLNIESLSNITKGELLARIAHRLTVVARDTYEVGTDKALEPHVLRAYNELLHRVTGAVSGHLLGQVGYSVQSILEMMDDFVETYNRHGHIAWAKELMAPYATLPEERYKIN